MKSDTLIGKQVVASAGWTIGTVKEIVFDDKTWRIGAIEVELEKPIAEEFEMKKLLSRTSVEIGVDTIRAVGDHVILAVDKPELRMIIASLASAKGPSK